MKKVVLSACFILALVPLLASCAQEPEPPPVSLNLDVTPKIVMDVKRISLTDRSGYTPPSIFKNDDFSPTIAEAIKGWAKDHLQAVGQNGQAIVVIKRAAITVQPLDVDDGIESWFTRQQDSKYTARADVSIEASGQTGFAVADASATRSVTMPEDPTLAEKRIAYNTLLNGLMKDLQENLQAAINSHMANFIAPAPGIPSRQSLQQNDLSVAPDPESVAIPLPDTAQPVPLSPSVSQSQSQIVPRGNFPAVSMDTRPR